MHKSSIAMLFAGISIVAAGPAPMAAQPAVDLSAEVGAVVPDGSLADYASTGFSILGRCTWHPPGAEVLGAWADFNFNIFGSETIRVRIPVEGTGGIPIPVDQTTTQSGFNTHLGLMLTNGSRVASLRPRIGAGLGLYNLRTETRWEGLGQEDPLAEETTDSDWGWGWRGVFGGDIFVNPSWGITLDFLYDEVFELDKRRGEVLDDSSSHFKTFLIGVTFALDRTR